MIKDVIDYSNEIILSIIIPLYNSEKYIKKCVDSCIKQDISKNNYEIIIVNDGSTDNSKEIVEEYAIFSNILIKNKNNGGVSSARNLGLEISRGKYIWFIDADDWIENNCIGKIINELESYKLEAIQIGYSLIDNTEKAKIKKTNLYSSDIISPQEFIMPSNYIGASWGTIIRKDIIKANNIRFDESIKIAEDQIFYLEYFKYVKRVKRVNYLVYNYVRNSNSITWNIKGVDLYKSIVKLNDVKRKSEYKIYIDYIISMQILLYINARDVKIIEIYDIWQKYKMNNKKVYNYYNNKSTYILKMFQNYGVVFTLLYRAIKYIKPLICLKMKAN